MQGDCLVMSLYRVALMPLASRMRETIPKALQPWYCDNAGAAGNAQCLDFLVKFGPQYGYFPKPGKSYYICKAEDEDTARQAFASFGLDINYSRGQRYLGGFIGSAKKKEEWSVGMMERWAAAVVALSTVAERYPQTAYAGFTFCMQNDWQYVQQVVADTTLFFSPLEEVIYAHTSSLPSWVSPWLRLMGSTVSSSPTASSWGAWQSTTLWTLPRVFTRPLLQQLVTYQCPLWTLPLGLTRGLIVCAPPKLVRRLERIGSRTRPETSCGKTG